MSRKPTFFTATEADDVRRHHYARKNRKCVLHALRNMHSLPPSLIKAWAYTTSRKKANLAMSDIATSGIIE
jgi:hypothetical protein